VDNRIDLRLKRTWDFFVRNAGGLLLGSLVVLAGSLLIVPGPWFALNLLEEVVECNRTDRLVRWQAAFDRRGNLLRSWGLALAMGIPILIGLTLLVVPGVLLWLYWFHAPVLVAQGRPVLRAMGESGQIFNRRREWEAYFLNWLVLAILFSLGASTVLILLPVLPFSFVYLVLCYRDETGTVTLESPGVHVPT
jgi:hypothetical protein